MHSAQLQRTQSARAFWSCLAWAARGYGVRCACVAWPGFVLRVRGAEQGLRLMESGKVSQDLAEEGGGGMFFRFATSGPQSDLRAYPRYARQAFLHLRGKPSQASLRADAKRAFANHLLRLRCDHVMGIR